MKKLILILSIMLTACGIPPYVAPNPTNEQLAQAVAIREGVATNLNGDAIPKDNSYDPFDRCGEGVTDTGAHEPLAAACVIHDEEYNKGGSDQQRQIVDLDFDSNCNSLALSINDTAIRDLELRKAHIYEYLVSKYGGSSWKPYDRNTATTEAQGQEFIKQAEDYINKIKETEK